MTKRFWSCALVTLLSAGVSTGFSLAGLLGPGCDDSFARYAASRSVALMLTVLIAIGVRSRMAIAFLGIAMTVVQAFDGVIGALARDPSKTYEPFAFAVPTHSRWPGSCEGDSPNHSYTCRMGGGSPWGDVIPGMNSEQHGPLIVQFYCCGDARLRV
jgi:hypothetical protein